MNKRAARSIFNRNTLYKACWTYPVSYILHPVSCILNPASYILHPASCFLRLASCILFLFTANVAHAQDYKKLIKELQAKNSQAERLHIVMSIQAFEDETAQQPFFQQKADVKKDGLNYAYRLGSNEMLMNDKYLIVVDNDMREIVCNKRDLDAEVEFKKAMQFDLDSILNLYKEPEFVGREGHVEHYRLKEPEGQIATVDLFIDASKKTLNKIEYHYYEKQVVIVKFEVFDTDITFSAGTFSGDKYVKIENGKLKPAGSYQKYGISGQL